jgi:murein DD-endopeptidase MepM/ murein hydrolase activator NlpD
MLHLALIAASLLAEAPAAFPRYITPVCGARVVSGFGYRVDAFTGRVAFHAGLDFAVESGQPVVASASGRAIAAERRGPYGLMIEIDHGHTDSTRYGHLSGLAVEAGDSVVQGQTIGWSGMTGRTPSPALHFEIWRDARVRDPREYLSSNPRCASR